MYRYPNITNQTPRIGFFSPSTALFSRRIPFVMQGIEILKSWDYKVEDIRNSFKIWGKLRSIEERINEFHSKLTDNNIDILFSVWGGKNSIDLLPHLDYNLISKECKPIIGVSDIAVLLNAISYKSKIITFHGPNVLGKLNQTKEVGLPFLKTEYNVSNRIVLEKTLCPNIQIVQNGISSGFLFGGSLGTFTLGLSGNDFIPKEKEIIFFFESASLDIYQTMQHLMNLKLSGFMSRVKGILIGAMTKIEDDTSFINYLKNSIVTNNIPIIKSDFIGHSFFNNPTLPIGLQVTFNTNSSKLLIEKK